MAATSRVTRTKGAQEKADFLATRSGGEVSREARIAELRRLVASGRYKVQPQQLALKILARALQNHHDV